MLCTNVEDVLTNDKKVYAFYKGKGIVLISVIVPVYMVEDYLERCVISLIQQKYEGKYEILLIDDGSKDRCGELCDFFANQYNNIYVHHKENGGLSSARNYGAEKANGEWVAFVDSDDYVSPYYLKDLMNLVNMFGADMAITNVILRTEEEDILFNVNNHDVVEIKTS